MPVVNSYGWVLLAAVAAAAAGDWYAVARRRRDLETVLKPAVMVLLVAFAWLIHADGVTWGRWLLAGLVLCLVGDVVLLRESDRAFGLGLAAFLLGHVAYVGAVLTMPRGDPLWVGVVAVVLAVAGVVGAGLLPLALRDPGEGAAPVAYALVIGTFAALAWWSGHPLLGLGASLFAVSDGLLAAARFWRPLPGGRVAVMVTYHLAQVLIVLGVLRPDLLSR